MSSVTTPKVNLPFRIMEWRREGKPTSYYVVCDHSWCRAVLITRFENKKNALCAGWIHFYDDHR